MFVDKEAFSGMFIKLCISKSLNTYFASLRLAISVVGHDHRLALHRAACLVPFDLVGLTGLLSSLARKYNLCLGMESAFLHAHQHRAVLHRPNRCE